MNNSAQFRFSDKMNFDFHAPRRTRGNLDASLSEMEQAQLIRALLEIEPAYLFKHALVQDTAYNSLMRHERKRLHQLVGETLESFYPERLDEYAAVLAHHYAQADVYDKTCEFAARAAEADLRVSAYPEARLHYAQALDAIARVTDSAPNRRRKIDLALRFLDLRWTSDTAGQDLALLDTLEESARALAVESNNAKEDQIQLAQIHLTRGGIFLATNQIAEAMQVYEQVLAKAQDLGEPQLLATPSVLIGAALNGQGFFGKALPLLFQAWDVFMDQPDGWQWVCLVHLSTALANLGRLEEARELVEAATMKLDRTNNLRASTFAHFSLANIALQERSMPIRLEHSRQAVENSRIGNDPLYRFIGLTMLALSESHLGQGDAAQAHMGESQYLREKMGGQPFFSDWAGAIYAEIALQLGDVNKAQQLAQEALILARSIDGWYAQGWAQRIWGEACLQMQPPEREQAHVHFAASLAAYEACQAPLEAARTRVAWGKVLHERGENDAACEHLEKASAQFEASGLMGELKETRVLLYTQPIPKT